MKNKKIFISILLLSLFTAFQVSITMFTHMHYINGVIITHSHPFSKKTAHAHSQTELVVIDRLADYHTLEVNTQPCNFSEIIVYGFICEEQAISIAHNKCCYVLSLRAPPASFIL